MTNEDIRQLFDRIKVIENEISLLKEDKKAVLKEFKDKVTPAAFNAALSSVKSKAKLKPDAANEYDQIFEFLENELCIDFIE